MTLKLLTQSVQIDDYIRIMIDDQERYMSYVRDQVAHEIAQYILKEFALHEEFPNDNFGTYTHQYTVMIEDDPTVIINTIVQEEREAREKRHGMMMTERTRN